MIGNTKKKFVKNNEMFNYTLNLKYRKIAKKVRIKSKKKFRIIL